MAEHELELDTAILRHSKAACEELSARVLQLPRELRDDIYFHLWGFPFYHEYDAEATFGKTLNSFGPTLVKLALPCTEARQSIPTCACLRKVPRFLDPGLVGRQFALEALEMYQKQTGTRTRYHARYLVHWSDMEAFATRDVLHLGLTLHEVLTNHHLTIDIGSLEDIGRESTLDAIGIPGSSGRLDRLVDALYALSKQKPRPITFAFEDRVAKTPFNLDYVLHKLSGPFHQMHKSGFDMTADYDNGGSRFSRRPLGVGKWTIGEDGWDPDRKDVWSWGLHQWNLHFTRSNEGFYPAGGMGESFYFPPNGPIAKHLSDPYCGRMQLWESIRRFLYRAFPDVEEAIVLKEGDDGYLYIDCGCPEDKHTCSDYYLCQKHDGWDRGSGHSNDYCYKCLGLEASD